MTASPGGVLPTAFTRLVGCAAPIQLAGMPLLSTPELVTAVADAGGLGMLGTALWPAPALEEALRTLSRTTDGAFGASFLVPFLDPAAVEAAARHARVVEFFYGWPDPELLKRAAEHGALTSWQVGSPEEAAAAQEAGADLLVAQGTEAGGHVRGSTSLFPLLARVLPAADVPVLAAGGIATAGDLAAVLAAGASGARLGTRFLASQESGAHPDYVRALVEARAGDTVLTEAFEVMWPGAPHRVLRSSLEAAQEEEREILGEVTGPMGTMPVPRLSVISPSRETSGRIDAMVLYAGESVENVDDVQPAAGIVRGLVEGAARLLAGTNP